LLCSGVTGITSTPSGSTSVPHHQLDRNRKKHGASKSQTCSIFQPESCKFTILSLWPFSSPLFAPFVCGVTFTKFHRLVALKKIHRLVPGPTSCRGALCNKKVRIKKNLKLLP
jgi:hypothetical protein